MDAHYREVYRFFCWLTRDPDAAADLTQETFAAFWASAAGLDRERVPDLKAWLYGIARNRWRKRQRDRTVSGPSHGELAEAAEVPDRAPGPEALFLGELHAEQVREAVAGLPEEYREALVLRVFQELSYAQVGRALGVTENLARWRVHRARLLLRRALLEGEAGARAAEAGTAKETAHASP